MKRVSRFERQLQYTDGTKRWAIAACSTKASRENGLQPTLLTTRLGEVTEPMYRLKVEVPMVLKEMCAIQLDNTVVGDVQKKLGLTGADAQLWPGKVLHVTSIIFMEFDTT